jgi:hypothetical protein
MLRDRFGTLHRTTSDAAVDAFGEAVGALASHRPTSADALKRALAADPELVAGHALLGLGSVMLARAELEPAARRAHADALAARLAKGGATRSERALTDALGLCVDGRLRAAADRLDAHLDESPCEFLHAKIAHALRFMSGDADGMLLGTARVIDAWSEDMPGYGYLLGCHAFALEEKGELEAAERIGRRAVELEPSDAWGLHAVSHVHEMQGRVDEGIAWIEGRRPVWSACNNFSFHMAWHLALFHLERGEHERVLASLHNILALVAGGEMPAARELVSSMSRKAVAGRHAPAADQSLVLDAVGCELAHVIVALGAPGGCDTRGLGSLAARVQRIGGSHAQRDVFLRTLAQAAADRGDGRALEQVLSVRRRIKRDDRFEGALRQRLAASAEPSRLSA